MSHVHISYCVAGGVKSNNSGDNTTCRAYHGGHYVDMSQYITLIMIRPGSRDLTKPRIN